MANRIVMNESWKCRSGRARDRVIATGPSTRGGEMPHAFGNNERVAAEDDGYVMMPSGKRAPFEVVETELSFELFVGALRAPPLLEQTDDLLPAHATRQRRQGEFGRLRLAFGPL